MAILKDDVLSVTEDKDTLGGSTYWVESSLWQGQEKAMCFRKVRSWDDGAYCSRPAGWGTDHIGTGGCKWHGGSAATPAALMNLEHGRGATVLRKSLQNRIDQYVESGDKNSLYDLSYQVGTMQVLLKEVIESFPEPGEAGYGAAITRITNMVQATGSLIDKISSIESRNALTAAQVLYLRARLADWIVKWLPDPEKRDLALAELASAIPGGKDDRKLVIVTT